MGIERLGRDRVSAIAATLDAEIADLAEGPLDALLMFTKKWSE